ncbi:ATP-binding mismatch repair protein [Blastocladiella emersonii ATCC 22665]|nr:ATP-binding mismatch repair protein [Blastocladiella emersonii ATCC 22665]
MDSDTALRICANQVIPDLATAVKELVENALDAKATSVEVRIHNYGLGGVHVSDNGSGIEPSDFATVAVKSATSKLREFDELDNVATTGFGFRGEALSSLCALATVSMTTCAAGQPHGSKLVFDARGAVASTTPAAAMQGTTVSIENLFDALPVRASEFRSNAKREYLRTVAMVQQYAVIATGARVTLVHVTAAGKKSTVFTTPPPPPGNFVGKPVTANLTAIFDAAAIKNWREVELEHPETGLRVVGGVTAGPGRPTADRQFLYLNGRPVDIPKVSRLVTACYREMFQSQTLSFVLNIIAAATEVDVNVTPDKRTVILVHEADLLDALKSYLSEKIFSTASTTLQVPSPVASVSVLTASNLRLKRRLDALNDGGSASVAPDATPRAKRHHRRIASLRMDDDDGGEGVDSADTAAAASREIEDGHAHDHAHVHGEGCHHAPAAAGTPTADLATDAVPALPDVSDYTPVDERVLRTLGRDDFARMRVIGQFNLGFLVVQIARPTEPTATESSDAGETNNTAASSYDLFLVDQHAADEKFNYERLLTQHTPRVQPLVIPRRIDLDPALVYLLDDPRVCRAGFHVSPAAAQGDGEGDAGSGWMLQAVPLDGRGSPMGVRDLVDVLLKIQSAASTDAIVPSRDEAVYASRACRSSVMIGMPLDTRRQHRIVHQLSGMRHPWNCPHGRPTTQFLFDLRDLDHWRDVALEKLDAEPALDASDADAATALPRVERWKQQWRSRSRPTWSGV